MAMAWFGFAATATLWLALVFLRPAAADAWSEAWHEHITLMRKVKRHWRCPSTGSGRYALFVPMETFDVSMAVRREWFPAGFSPCGLPVASRHWATMLLAALTYTRTKSTTHQSLTNLVGDRHTCGSVKGWATYKQGYSVKYLLFLIKKYILHVYATYIYTKILL